MDALVVLLMPEDFETWLTLSGQSTSHLRTGKILFLQGLLVDSEGMVAYALLTSLRKKRF